jgi:hypothetical protein
MTPEQIEQWAREAAFIPTAPRDPSARTWLAFDSELAEFARLVAQATWERAAVLANRRMLVDGTEKQKIAYRMARDGIVSDLRAEAAREAKC